ncbi:hypothetical protein RYX36_026667, partial [Vicia faba]
MILVGKWVVAYLPSIRLKSYYIACACGEIYAPPCAYVYFFGFTIEVTFLRGVYDKLGIEPQVVTALLDGAHSNWLDKVSSARDGKETIAVIRASGRIRRTGDEGIIAEDFIKKDPSGSNKFKAAIIRINSNGGDILASD